MAIKPKSVAPRTPRSKLASTDVPGVLRNRAGVLVDINGVALGFKDIRKADDARFQEVLGRKAETVLDVMEGVALDPRNPMHVRVDVASKVAPYKHPKLVAVQGVAGAAPINMNYEGKSDKELADIRARLEELATLMTGRS